MLVYIWEKQWLSGASKINQHCVNLYGLAWMIKILIYFILTPQCRLILIIDIDIIIFIVNQNS